MNISVSNYWDNTLQACKTTLGLLSAFDGENYDLIDKTSESLRELIQHGCDFDSLKAFHQKSTPSTSTIDTKGKEKQKQVYSSDGSNNIVDYQDPNWSIINDKTVHITIESTGDVIVAKAVTTPEELGELVSKMYESKIAALDCEFIALKNAPPQLQLLQVAVSATEGYAIVIDKIDIDVLNDKLKPCLEDSKMNFVGWAFRGDALAIESTFKGINLAPVLDLQAKLRPIAVEEMNLLSGVTSYAAEWSALKQFQNAKLLGGSFDYHETDCIWLKDPLPPSALVYSVFDVVSLIELLQSTSKYPTSEEHYWPFTILKTSNRKSINNWHKQRAMGYSAPIIDTKNLKNQSESSFSSKRGYKNQRKNFPSNFKPVDPDTQYKEDLQKALYLSLKESASPRGDGYASSSKLQDRVIDTDELEIQYSDLSISSNLAPSNQSVMPCFADAPTEEEEEEPALEFTWADIVNEKQKPFLGLNFDEQINPDHSNSKRDSSPLPSSSSVKFKETPITIMKSPTDQPEECAKDDETSSPSSSIDATTKTTDSSPMRQLFSAKPKRSSRENSLFSSKPDKANYAKDMKTGGGVGNQIGTFGWDDETYNGGEGQAWKNFAQTAKLGWTKNIDMDINVIDEIKPSSPSSQKQQREEIAFNTSVNHVLYNQSVLSSDHNEWEVETERPTVMKMEITKYETQKSSGPRCINPADIDITDDDSDDDDSDDDDSDGDSDNTKGDDKNNKNAPNDEKESKNSTITSPSKSGWCPNSQESGQTDWASWSNKNYNGNQNSRRSSYERNNNTRQNRNSGGSFKNDRSPYQNSGYSSGYDRNYNNSYNHNGGYNNNYYNSNYKNNYNNYYNNNNNNNNTWQKRNPGSSTSYNTTSQSAASKQVMSTASASVSDEPTNYFDLAIFYSEYYTKTGDTIKIFKLSQSSHLDMIILPPLEERFTVAITYHMVPSNNGDEPHLKALQFYLPDNSSYNVIIGQTCHENNIDTSMNSKLATLLTHPNINRIAWFPEPFVKPLYEKTGIEIGRVVDLGLKAHVVGEEAVGSQFISVINHYLKDWPSLQQFTDAKQEYDNARNKFVNPWDKETIPDFTLEYSALQGSALFKLYNHKMFSSVSDQDYIYKKK